MARPYRRRRRPSSGRWSALRQAASVGLPLLVGLGAVLVGVALGRAAWPGLARAVFEALDSATGLAVLFGCGLLGRLVLPLTYPPPPRTARASSARVPRGFAAR
jgi:hypothetical protein